MLGYQAWLMLDAICRASWRMFVSHRHLLEWIPADLLSSSRSDLRSFYRRMANSVVLTLATAALAVFYNGGKLPALALPFLLLWTRRAIDRVADQPYSACGGEVRPVCRPSSANCD